MAGALRCPEDVDPGLGKAVGVEDGEPELVDGTIVRLVLDEVPTGKLVTDEFETEKLATVEVEVGGGVEAERTVVGMAVGPRMAVARESSAPKPSCATAKRMPPVVFFMDLARLASIKS